MSGEHAHSPLAQFEIKPLLELPLLAGYPVHFTNSSAAMMTTIILIILFLSLGIRKHTMIPGRWQSMVETSYTFILSMIKENIGNAGRQYFPLIFTIFMFVLFSNLVGLLPYSFTSTSHIIVTFAMAAAIFIGVTLVAMVKQGPLHFLAHFYPKGMPGIFPVRVLISLMVFTIELISYLSRPVSLSLRLAVNMTAGHTLLKVIAGFVFSMGFLGGWVPLVSLVVLTGFEIFVAVLQAYIFTILTCIYLNDALHSH
jgi:F-type H+-transporting ATPase subunit a